MDAARRKGRVKHGGGLIRVSLDDAGEGVPARDVDLVRLDEALTRLESHDAALSQVVMLRFFAGLEVEEAAKALGISETTVKRRWVFARAWLHHQLTGARTSP